DYFCVLYMDSGIDVF
nr:immunoglobulin light chain junction region [Macaca mulatta]